MPVYDFKCDKCGTIKEYYVKSFNSFPDKCSCGNNKKFKKVESF
jgi:putative FmdB family regulatory protein